MSKSLKPSNNYLSSKDAGAQLGYTHDYISRLCRHDKMSGIQKGREWFVTQEELDAFKGRHEVELQIKKKELSKKFSKIRTEYEAQKRRAREEAKILQDTPPVKSIYINNENETVQKHVKFSMPNQFIAAGALTALLFGSTFLNTISNNPNLLQGQKFSLSEAGITVEQGIHQTIYAQSTVVEPVAAVFTFMRYLDDGYAQVFSVIGELPKATYDSLHNIGNGYLTLYLLQGEAVYESLLGLHDMGKIVLRGYELIGESFYFGSKDILSTYARVLNLKSRMQTSLNTTQSFGANVGGGFEYVQEQVSENFIKTIIDQLGDLGNMWTQNIKSNVFSMHSNISKISQDMSAYVGSLFTFDLVNKEPQIRTLKIKN